MPSYSYRRGLPPGAMKESLAAVKVRLQLEMTERTDKRVKYWQKRETWCRASPGRKLILGWDTIAVPYSHMQEPFSRNRNTLGRDTVPANVLSSCVETPD